MLKSCSCRPQTRWLRLGLAPLLPGQSGDDLQRRASDYTYRNITDNKDRMVRELYYMGVYDKETLLAKTLEESEQDSPW